MASQPALKNYYTFAKGLVTESSPLVAAENACVAMSNVLLGSDGSLFSRPALELLGSPVTIQTSTGVGSSFSYAIAESIQGDVAGSTRLAMYLGGTYIYILDIEDTSAPTLIAEVAVPPTASGYSLSAGRGVFCATSAENDPLIIDCRTGAYSHKPVVLFERDYVGIDDGYPTNFRPESVLTDEHYYNLLNQGWNDTGIAAVLSGLTAYPSNSDVYASGIYKDASTGLPAFSAAALDTVGAALGHAPRGHVVRGVFNQAYFGDFVDYGPTPCISLSIGGGGTTFTIEVFNDWTGAPYSYSIGATLEIEGCSVQYRDGSKSNWRDLSGTHAITAISYNATTDRTAITFNIPDGLSGYQWTWQTWPGAITSQDVVIYNPQAKTEAARPRCSAFYAGRLWYSGIQPNSNYKLQSSVYYSKTLEDISLAGHCFTAADPTSVSDSDPVDTDGGSVVVSEMGTVYQMLVVGNELVLLSENGVWSISGTNRGIFSPLGFSVRKLSTRGVRSARCAVLADGTGFYYTNRAIYAIVQDQNSGQLNVVPASDSITSYLNTVASTSDETLVTLSYDQHNKRVHIFFGVDESEYGTKNTTDLVFDTKLGAYCPLTFSGTYTDSSNYAGLLGAIGIPYQYTADTGVVFPVLKNDSGTLAVEFYSMSNEDSITDGHYSGANETESYFTPCSTPLDSARIIKGMPRIGVYLQRKEESSLKVQGRFSWSNNGDSGKWGTKQECYKDRGENFDVCWRTLSVRGQGKAVQLHFTNDALSPFKIYGWDVQYEGSPE